MATALLLIHLFVLKAAADCPPPQPGSNIVLTTDTLLLNRFPDGDPITVECARGFVPEKGSGIMTCVSGNWTEPDLTCKKKDCGVPIPRPNMSFNTNTGTLYGDIITVICDKGYQIRGSSYKQCFASGWSGRAQCKIATCAKPGEVANGKSSWDSQEDPKYGEIIHYICNEGYTIVGANSIVCNEIGVYDSPPPVCRGPTTEDSTVRKITPSATTPTTQGLTTDNSTVRTTTPSASTPTTQGLTTDNSTVRTTTASASTPTTQEASTTSESAPTSDRDTTVSTAAAPSITASIAGNTFLAPDTNEHTEHAPILVSVTCIALAVCIIVFFLHKYLLRRKGSYDTREDLKPELLHFQNL